MENEVVTVSGNLPVDITKDALNVEVAKRAIESVRELMNSVMEKHVHYGMIPGTKRNTLYQPGADLINFHFQFRPEFAFKSVLRNEKVISYTVECSLVHRPTGVVIATGIGSCNTLEQKYQQTIISRNRNAAKAGKAPITHWELDNVMVKMAQKRAKIAADLNAIPISHLFTQDTELVVDDAPEEKVEAVEDGLSQVVIDQIQSLAKAVGLTVAQLYDGIKQAYGKLTIESLEADQASDLITRLQKKLKERKEGNGDSSQVE